MIFVDINTFYNERGGGIRTYHQQKCLWFRSHPEHEYYVLYPGPRHMMHRLYPNVTMVSFRGLAVTDNPDGYRLFYDFIRMGLWIRRLNPDVVEAGEPWLAGPFTLLYRLLGWHRKLICAFYHSDPIVTYALPWSIRIRRSLASRPALPVVRLCARLFYWMQNRYDWTLVSSTVMENHLRKNGVSRLTRLPFGYDDTFAKKIRPRAPQSPGAIKFLYVGRLHQDKGIDVLQQILFDVLDTDFPEGVLRVVGSGPSENLLRKSNHPRCHLQDFVGDREELAKIYADSHVLLAPGPFETFGLTVLEGLAAGLIVVGPDTGGVGEMLQAGKSPFTFRSGDAADFRRGVRAAASAAGIDFATESERSRKIADSYGTWSEAVGRMVAFYQKHAG